MAKPFESVVRVHRQQMTKPFESAVRVHRQQGEPGEQGATGEKDRRQSTKSGKRCRRRADTDDEEAEAQKELREWWD